MDKCGFFFFFFFFWEERGGGGVCVVGLGGVGEDTYICIHMYTLTYTLSCRHGMAWHGTTRKGAKFILSPTCT